MAELYKGIAGSPITYLASDISASQTTISIADDSALPDAPNICTIGYGEHLETIKYETKSNGVLQEVVRGIEGTPRAWQKGTEVARFFTAYDHNAIIDSINSHLAESANEFNKRVTKEWGEVGTSKQITLDSHSAYMLVVYAGSTSISGRGLYLITTWGGTGQYNGMFTINDTHIAEVTLVEGSHGVKIKTLTSSPRYSLLRLT